MEASCKCGRIGFSRCYNCGRRFCLCKSHINRLDSNVISFIGTNVNATIVNTEDNDEYGDHYALISPYNSDKIDGGSDDDSDAFALKYNY